MHVRMDLIKVLNSILLHISIVTGVDKVHEDLQGSHPQQTHLNLYMCKTVLHHEQDMT